MVDNIETGGMDTQSIYDALIAAGLTEQDLVNLDGATTAAIYGNEVFTAYFELAFKELYYIIDPDAAMSLAGAIGMDWEDIDYDTLVANSEGDFVDFLNSIIEDCPEVMAAFAAAAGGGQSEADAVTALLNEWYYSESDLGEASYDGLQDAEDLYSDYSEYLGDGYLWMMEEEKAFDAAMESIANQLGLYDEQYLDLWNSFYAGDITDTELQAGLDDIQYGRQLYTQLLSSVSEAKYKFFEILSEIIQKMNEMNTSIASRMTY